MPFRSYRQSDPETRFLATPPAPPRVTYLPGLDGLRALAVLVVLLYHSSLNLMPGGFLGVQVFFVISGYLITSLLLTEWHAREGIDLLHFWVRRARRLLPALFVVIVSAQAFAVLFLPDEVAGLRGDALAAAGYVTNWYLIFAHQSYFETMGRPSLLRHLWSLAVEEQYYLFFPPLLLILLRWLKPRGAFLVVLAGAFASALWMALLYQPDVDPSRVYYGTDTRASALLLGAALAFIWKSDATHRVSARLLDLGGFVALGLLAAACLWLDEFNGFLYQGGLFLVALLTIIVIAAIAHSQTRLTRLLGIAPLRWIGLRSYGLYLWHWLVFDVTRPQLDVSLTGLPLFLLQVGISLLLADLSYRLVESPVRSGALGRALQALREAQGTRRRSLAARWVGVIGAIALVSVALGGSVVSAQEPPPPAYLALAPALETQTPTMAPTLPPTVAPTTASTATAAVTATATTMPTALPSPTSAPTLAPAPRITQVYAIGDSVMLGAVSELRAALGNADIDAVEGRQVSQGLAIIQSRRAAGRMDSVVVIHLGTNGTFSARQFTALMGVLADVPRVVVVNDKVPRAWESVNNAVISSGAKQYPNVVLLDWNAASANHPEYFWKDGIHLRPAGAQAYASLIAAAVYSQ